MEVVGRHSAANFIRIRISFNRLFCYPINLYRVEHVWYSSTRNVWDFRESNRLIIRSVQSTKFSDCLHHKFCSDANSRNLRTRRHLNCDEYKTKSIPHYAQQPRLLPSPRGDWDASRLPLIVKINLKHSAYKGCYVFWVLVYLK